MSRARIVDPVRARRRDGAESVDGTIAGVVRDGSGGVLPGVTVEAASPALIEKVRTVITRFGTAWQNATSVLGPRTVKLGVNVTF